MEISNQDQQKTISEFVKTTKISQFMDYVQSYTSKYKYSDADFMPVTNSTIALLANVYNLQGMKDLDVDDEGNPTYQTLKGKDLERLNKAILQSLNKSIEACTPKELKDLSIAIDFIAQIDLMGKVKALIELNK